jgi:murein DD-endopeptidase MepM/ murein hydrolase activator NlpD
LFVVVEVRVRRLVFVFFACVGALIGAGPAVAFPGGPWVRPVTGPVARGFDPPATPFGPGHLGVDFGVPPGTPVRAANDGTVVFAGRVGTALHVVVLHADDVRTTDSFLASVTVVRGQRVARGDVIGTSGGVGPQHAADVLHFGVRVGGDYIDPMLLFAPPDLGSVVHLAEPHGGSFAAAAVGGPVSAGEVVALADEARIDARPPLRAPPWWGTAPMPVREARSSATSAPTTTVAAHRHDHPIPAPVPAIAAVAAAPAGAFLLIRRRRRAYR